MSLPSLIQREIGYPPVIKYPSELAGLKITDPRKTVTATLCTARLDQNQTHIDEIYKAFCAHCARLCLEELNKSMESSRRLSDRRIDQICSQTSGINSTPEAREIFISRSWETNFIQGIKAIIDTWNKNRSDHLSTK